jgi:hypothetical protein
MVGERAGILSGVEAKRKKILINKIEDCYQYQELELLQR